MQGVELILPVDFVVSSKFGEDGEIKEATKETGIPDGFLNLLESIVDDTFVDSPLLFHQCH